MSVDKLMIQVLLVDTTDGRRRVLHDSEWPFLYLENARLAHRTIRQVLGSFRRADDDGIVGEVR